MTQSKSAKEEGVEEGERNSLAIMYKMYSYPASLWDQRDGFCQLCQAQDETVTQQRHFCSTQEDCIKIVQ